MCLFNYTSDGTEVPFVPFMLREELPYHGSFLMLDGIAAGCSVAPATAHA